MRSTGFILLVVAGLALLCLLLGTMMFHGDAMEIPNSISPHEQPSVIDPAVVSPVDTMPPPVTPEVPGPTETVNEPPPPVSGLRLRIVDADARPLPQARIALYRTSVSSHSGRAEAPELFSVTADAEWLLPPDAPADGSLMVAAAGCRSAWMMIADLSAQADNGVITVVLHAGYTIHGELRGATARQLANGMAWLISQGGEEQGSFVDEQGRFTLAVSVLGSHVVQLELRGLTWDEPVELTHDGQQLLFDIPGRATLAGSVFDGGRRVSDAEVICVCQAGDERRFSWKTRTDEKGAYEFFGLPAGAAVIVLPQALILEPLSLRDGENRLDLTLPSAALLGGVHDAGTGMALPQANVILRRQSPVAAGFLRDVYDRPGLATRVASPEPDGRFAMAPLADGSYLLLAFAPGYAEHTRALELAPSESRSVDIALQPASQLAVTVLDVNNAPVPAPLVLVKHVASDILTMHALQGAYPAIVGDFAAGEYWVAAYAEGKRVAYQKVSMELNRPSELTLMLPEPLPLIIQSQSSTGAPLGEVEIVLTPAGEAMDVIGEILDPLLSRSGRGMRHTDEQGRIALDVLPDGVYSLVAQAEGCEITQQELTIRAGVSGQVNLILTPRQ